MLKQRILKIQKKIKSKIFKRKIINKIRAIHRKGVLLNEKKPTQINNLQKEVSLLRNLNALLFEHIRTLENKLYESKKQENSPPKNEENLMLSPSQAFLAESENFDEEYMSERRPTFAPLGIKQSTMFSNSYQDNNSHPNFILVSKGLKGQSYYDYHLKVKYSVIGNYVSALFLNEVRSKDEGESIIFLFSKYI